MDSWTADESLYIGGEFEPRGSRAVLVVDEKATGTPLGEVVESTVEDVDRAARAATRAQMAWADLSFRDRIDLLLEVRDEIGRRKEILSALIVRETGSVPPKAEGEVDASRNEILEAVGLVSRAGGDLVPTSNSGKLSLIERVPVGVVGVITPWNFPFHLGFRAIAPALALGNAVVLKAAPATPLAGGSAIAHLFDAVDAPAGLVNVVPGGDEAGKAVVDHPDVRMIHFTGSCAAGRHIAEAAGRQLKKVSLELGGNNAFIVLDDADPAAAAAVGAWSSFFHQGQVCIAASRHIVQREIAGEYTEALAERARSLEVGDPATALVDLGPMISERQRDRAHDFLRETLARGADLVTGGSYDRLFYAPTVVTGVEAGMPLFDEEVFAPIASVTVVESEGEALETANQTEYGLVAAIFTGDAMRGWRLARKIRSGMVHVNDTTLLDEPQIPFGGIGASGLGERSGGDANIAAFTESKWVSLQSEPVQYPFFTSKEG